MTGNEFRLGELERKFTQMETLLNRVTRDLDISNRELKRVTELAANTQLELDEALQNQLFARLDHKTIEQAIILVITTHFNVTIKQLEGKNEKRHAGRKPMSKIRRDLYLDEARMWFLSLARQLTYQTKENLRINFPWVLDRNFADSRRIIEEIQADKLHEDYNLWRTLLEKTAQKARELDVDNSVVLDELQYV